MMKPVPFWRKFMVNLWRCEGGWMLRVLFGFVHVAFFWNYFFEWAAYEKMTGIGLGYIPWKLSEGGLMPYRDLVKRQPVVQVHGGGGTW